MSPREGVTGHRAPTAVHGGATAERQAPRPSEGTAAGGSSGHAMVVPRRMHEIDGLRAVAVALIVFHHSFTSSIVGSPRPRSAGALFSSITTSGVELFFVLSGVLLLRPYLRDHRAFLPVRYLRRRIERLWPPYVAALLLAGGVVAIATAHPTWYSTEVLPHFSFGDWLAQIALLNFGWRTYSGAWWSLTIEVVFYISVPLVVVVIARCDSRGRRILAAVLVAAAVPICIALASPNSAAVPDVMAMFAPCFIMGALLARYSPRPAVAVALVAGGTAYVALATWWPRADVHLGFALFYGGILVLSTTPSTRLHRLLARPLLVWVGERSYSLFLVHFPLFYLANWYASTIFPSRTAGYFLLTRGLGIPLALFVAMVIFWFVERRYARGLATAHSFWPLHQWPA